MATFDRRIAAVESLARDRFDSDCVLGTQFEVLSAPPRTLGLTEISPNPAISPEFGGVRRVGFVSRAPRLELRRLFGPFVSGLKIPFPGNGDLGSKRLGSMPREPFGQSTTPPTCAVSKTCLVTPHSIQRKDTTSWRSRASRDVRSLTRWVCYANDLRAHNLKGFKSLRSSAHWAAVLAWSNFSAHALAKS